MGDAMVFPTNSFLLLGVLTSVPIYAKIDQEMRPRECTQTDTRNPRFIIYPMRYAIAMWQIKQLGKLNKILSYRRETTLQGAL